MTKKTNKGGTWALTKVGSKVKSYNDQNLGIQSFGPNNNYPQMIQKVTSESPKGKPCLATYRDFVYGDGFIDERLYDLILSVYGDTADDVLQSVCDDYTMFGGFSLHFNFNELGEITTITNIPFETVRFESLDRTTKDFHRVAIHSDWTRQNTWIRAFEKRDIVFIELFDPESVLDQIAQVGGIDNYKGQVLYYSRAGDKVYPTPIFENILKDMVTDRGLSVTKLRITENNFMPSAILANINNSAESEKQTEELQQTLSQFQGSDKVGNALVISVESTDEIPVVIPFSNNNNYSRDFATIEKSTKSSIGEGFSQPPIIRGEDVGSNFGANAIANAYDFYNSVTESDRYTLTRLFASIFQYWENPQDFDFTIQAKKYKFSVNYSELTPEMMAELTSNERRELMGYTPFEEVVNDKQLLSEKLGVGGTQSLVAIVSDPTTTTEQKSGLLKILFGLTDEEITIILPK